jgi:hypothetical protein
LQSELTETKTNDELKLSENERLSEKTGEELYQIGVEKNMLKAIELYQLSANQGFACAQSNLACCYENGYGIEKI